MITWDDNIICPPEMRDNINRIRRRLRWRKNTAALTYCITLATNGDNLFDIYNMGELLFKYYQKSDTEVHIVGLATSKEQACELVGDILSDIYEKTGAMDVRSYFLNK